jgi:predicted TIM-barrel fold metal-dependent hydrolase
MEEAKAIDILYHLFTPEAVQKMFYDQPEFQRIMKWWGIEKKSYTPEQFVAMMDEAGVEKVIVPADKMQGYRDQQPIWNVQNEELAAVIGQYPDRLVGLAGINPLLRMEGVREFEEGVKKYGFKGAYIHAYGYGIPLNHRLYYPFYAKACELGVAIMMQVGHSAEHLPSEMGRPIYIDDIALDFPELTLIGSHTGWPWVEEMIAMAWKHENVYVGIDAHMPKYLDKSLINFMKSRGKNKTIYGTNGLSWKVTLGQLKEIVPDDEVRRLIMRENAVKAFKL